MPPDQDHAWNIIPCNKFARLKLEACQTLVHLLVSYLCYTCQPRCCQYKGPFPRIFLEICACNSRPFCMDLILPQPYKMQTNVNTTGEISCCICLEQLKAPWMRPCSEVPHSHRPCAAKEIISFQQVLSGNLSMYALALVYHHLKREEQRLP